MPPLTVIEDTDVLRDLWPSLLPRFLQAASFGVHPSFLALLG